MVRDHEVPCVFVSLAPCAAEPEDAVFRANDAADRAHESWRKVMHREVNLHDVEEIASPPASPPSAADVGKESPPTNPRPRNVAEAVRHGKVR